MDGEQSQSHGLKSLNTALQVLSYLRARSGPTTLSDISRECGMQPSKVHRYLATFVETGLVRQEGRSGRYDLGPEALQLGLAAIARHDFVNDTSDGLPELVRQTGMTALLAVWGNEGATIVRWERGASPTVTSFGLGTTLPLLNSATGRAFLAYAPEAAIAKLRDYEMNRISRNPSLAPDIKATQKGLKALTGDIRERGFASVDGKFIPGLVAAAAPVLDWQRQAQAVVTLVGTDPETVKANSPVVMKLAEFCRKHSVVRDQD